MTELELESGKKKLNFANMRISLQARDILKKLASQENMSMAKYLDALIKFAQANKIGNKFGQKGY